MPRLRKVRRRLTFEAKVQMETDGLAKLLAQVPPAITTRYWNDALNPTIRMGWVQASIRAGDYREVHDVLVSLACQPRPRIVLEIPGSVGPELFFESIDKGDEVEVLNTGSVPPLPRKRSPGTDPFVTIFPPMSFGDGRELYRVGFGLFNFPDAHGSVVLTKRGKSRSMTAGRIALQSDEWFIAIDPAHGLRERYQTARARGAYLLSHAGVIGRVDGATFTGEQVEEVTSGLYWLFAFALGRRTGPILPYATNRESERPVWTQWAMRATDSAGGGGTWFDLHHTESLNGIFGPFMELWRQPALRRVLIRIISWYVQAQDINPVEAAIPAAQIALETLVATVPVRPDLDDPALGSNAAGKLARLLIRTGIPIDIPAELQELRKASGPKPWRHGPEAITHLRNDITHPRQDRAWTSAAMIEAWKLSLWYLELAMLAWLGYRGQHNRRTREDRSVGLVEPVPWAV